MCLLFCKIAFGLWAHAVWVDCVAVAGMLIFLASFNAAREWQHAYNKSQRETDSANFQFK